MPQSATGTWTAERGFTLLEVLVTLALIGILTGVAVLSVSGLSSPGSRLDSETRRLAVRIEHHRDEAVLLGETRGLLLAPDRYHLLRRSSDGEWRILDDGHILPEGFQLGLRVDDRSVTLEFEAEPPPQILLTATGELSPFRIELRGPEDTVHRLSADLLGGVTREALP